MGLEWLSVGFVAFVFGVRSFVFYGLRGFGGGDFFALPFPGEVAGIWQELHT